MNRQEALAILLEEARRAGVPAADAIALWEQESGFSTDINLPHQELSRNRGHAVGPFGIVPYYHPQADLSSLRSQARYALNEYKRIGPRGYYGTGKPPPGFPTTDQYVKQLNARAERYRPREPKPKLQAATMFDYPTPPELSPPEQPEQTGQPDLSAFLGPPMIEDRPLDPVQRLMNNPLTHIGLGILATPTGQGSWLQGVARGTLAGMQAFQAQQRLNAEIEETLERQRQRASRKELENMRLRLAATMPGLSDLERNLLITDPSAFSQIYAAKLLQQQKQQQANTYQSVLSGAGESPQPELGTAPPQGMPGGGTYQQPELSMESPQTLPPIELPPPDTTGAMPADQVMAQQQIPAGPSMPTSPSMGYPGVSPGPGAEPPLPEPKPITNPLGIDIEALKKSLPGEAFKLSGELSKDVRTQQAKIDEEIRKRLADRPKEYREGTTKLRQEYQGTDLWRNWARIQRASENAPELVKAANAGNRAADAALITMSANVQDPGSAVMEGEAVRQVAGRTLSDVVQEKLNFFNKGGTLSPAMRRDLAKIIQTTVAANGRALQDLENRYADQAVRYGWEPLDVIGKPISWPEVGYGLEPEQTNIPEGYELAPDQGDGITRIIRKKR